MSDFVKIDAHYYESPRLQAAAEKGGPYVMSVYPALLAEIAGHGTAGRVEVNYEEFSRALHISVRKFILALSDLYNEELIGVDRLTRGGAIVRDKAWRRLPIPRSLRQEIIERDERMCGICGDYIGPDEKLELDHIMPVSLGGTNDADNLQSSHSICNRRKGARVA